jgi:hypothetical protein
MFSRYTRPFSEEAGFDDPTVSYLAGRAGVLGPVDPAVVGAATVFFAPDTVRTRWELACRTVDVHAYARRWITGLHAWGRARLDGLDRLGRLADLATAVALEADDAGAPLFAAWRSALAPPDDPPGRAAHAIFLLREHRGAMHAAAVLTGGLTPLQAVLTGPGGEPNAVTFGWTGPYEDPAPLAAIRAQVDAATERAAARPYEVLDDREQAELAGRLEKAVAHVDPRATLGGG